MSILFTYAKVFVLCTAWVHIILNLFGCGFQCVFLWWKLQRATGFSGANFEIPQKKQWKTQLEIRNRSFLLNQCRTSGIFMNIAGTHFFFFCFVSANLQETNNQTKTVKTEWTANYEHDSQFLIGNFLQLYGSKTFGLKLLTQKLMPTIKLIFHFISASVRPDTGFAHSFATLQFLRCSQQSQERILLSTTSTTLNHFTYVSFNYNFLMSKEY